MNGALGWVRGFVWPEGGDPRSADKSKQAPVCVVVEFDDVNLGEEQAKNSDGSLRFDEKGVPVMVPRTFFPNLDLGVDEKGVPRSRKCVPIFRHKVSSVENEQVVRHQFPLTLAWALTHWKAQGMTLPRARVQLSKRTAAQPGIGFVAVTRVKHPRDLLFEEDLPDWEDFQQAQ